MALCALRDLADQLHLKLAAHLNHQVARPVHLHGLLVDKGLPVSIEPTRRTVLEHLEQLRVAHVCRYLCQIGGHVANNDSARARLLDLLQAEI